MKKKLHLLLLLFVFTANAQVGVGTTTPNSQLDIRSSNQATPANTDGILIPKIDTFPAVNPTAAQQGMLVYLTTAAGPKQPGFYYWDNPTLTWVGFGTANPDADWYEVATTTAPDAINDDMFHMGRVSIGKNTTAYPLEIENNAYGYNINNVNNAASALNIGIRNTMQGTAGSEQMGVFNNITSTDNSVHYGMHSQLSGNGGGNHFGTSSILSGSGGGGLFGSYNELSNSGNGWHYGTFNLLTGAGTSPHYGSYAELTGSGTGTQIGGYNTISNTGNANHLGQFNVLTGVGNGTKTGTYNDLYGAGNGEHRGTYNTLAGTGTGNHYGVYSTLSGGGSGEQIGAYNEISSTGGTTQRGVFNNFLGNSPAVRYGLTSQFGGSGDGNHFGNATFIANTGNGIHHGHYTTVNGSGSGAHYGILAELSGTGTGIQTGLQNNIFNSGNAAQYGVNNALTGNGNGAHYGVYNALSGSGGNGQFGVYSTLTGTGAGNKYGISSFIDPAAGGTGYGVHSQVLKPGSFAGYFLGSLAIGTTTANTYTMPSSRGTNLQIMQTDGVGNVGWRDMSVAMNNIAWLTTGNAGLTAANFLGTTDAIPLIFRSNNTERMRINPTDGEIVAGATASPYLGDLFATVSTAALTFGVNGYTNQNGSGVWGETLSGASNFSAVQGVYSGTGVGSGAFGNYNGTNTATTRAGVTGYNATAPGNGGAGVYGYYGGGNTATNQHMGVLGGYISSTYGIGVYGIGFGGGIITGSVDAAIVGWRQNNANYSGYFNGNHVIANGTKSASVGTSKGNQLLYVTETPGVWFEDIGRGRLVNGTVEIKLDPLFLETVAIDDQHPMSVFLQEEGDSNGLYVIPGKDGFVVKEKNGGTSNIAFSYRIMAKRLHFQDHRFGNDPVWGAGDTRRYSQYATPPPVDYNENLRFQEAQRRNYKPTPMPEGFVSYEQLQAEAKKLETEKKKRQTR